MSFPEKPSKRLLAIIYFHLFLSACIPLWVCFISFLFRKHGLLFLCVCVIFLKKVGKVCKSWVQGTHSALLGSGVPFRRIRAQWSSASSWLKVCFPLCDTDVSNQPEMRLAQWSGILYLVGGSLFSLCLLETFPKNPTFVFKIYLQATDWDLPPTFHKNLANVCVLGWGWGNQYKVCPHTGASCGDKRALLWSSGVEVYLSL